MTDARLKKPLRFPFIDWEVSGFYLIIFQAKLIWAEQSGNWIASLAKTILSQNSWQWWIPEKIHCSSMVGPNNTRLDLIPYNHLARSDGAPNVLHLLYLGIIQWLGHMEPGCRLIIVYLKITGYENYCCAGWNKLCKAMRYLEGCNAQAHAHFGDLSLSMQMFCCKDILINTLKIRFLPCLSRRWAGKWCWVG